MIRALTVTSVGNSARGSGVLTQHGEGLGPGPRVRVQQVGIAAGEGGANESWNEAS